MKVKKGDFVRVISGAHKGVEGQIIRIFKEKNKLFLEEIKSKKHQKPNQEKAQGTIKEIHKPIDISNVMAFDPKKKVLTKIGYRWEKKKKVRFAKKTGKTYEY